jgi:NAD(P)-dependent dehydrogenase (short-subunit alcohol dehydrogenase family)
MPNFQDKPSAVITGGGTGIGLAIAERFLKEGWRAVVIGRRLEPLENLKRRQPDDVLVLQCDLTKPESVHETCDLIAAEPRFNQVRCLVNNAGIYEKRAFKQTGDTLWQAMFETNLLGAVRMTRELLPLIEKHQGSIVNVSSTLGLKPVDGTSAYSALKAAMINWTQTLAIECAKQNVRANCICPGIVDTPIHAFHGQTEDEKAASLGGLQPLGRIGQPSDIAHGVWSLAGPGSEWITGSVLNVDGGIFLA